MSEASVSEATTGPRGLWRRWRDEPNPVWLREMRQSARLTRTPFILLTITALTALLLCTIGGAMAGRVSPAITGVTLFHTFFSVAFYVVAIAGPAVAANSIASEREGRTWEALQLTGLSPGVVARGKFLAAYTNVAMYIVMMAPVGALPFLFGGVTATEVIVAFVWLFLFAALFVAFGLAVSSKMDSVRAALLVTMVVAILAALFLHLSFGVGGSGVAHDLWNAVPSGPPVWLPTAYDRAPFDLQYLGLLVGLPSLLVAVPAWFLYEATIANLTSVTDDRSTGLRRWFLATNTLAVVASILGLLALPTDDRAKGGAMALSGEFCLLLFSVMVFLGDPIGPSRRVQNEWDARRAGRLRRLLGPGVMRSAWIHLLAGSGAVLALGFASGAMVMFGPASHLKANLLALLLLSVYGLSFFAFLVGFSSWLRTRTGAIAVARVILLVVLFCASAGPWIIAAIAGALTQTTSTDELLIAAPSPFFAIMVAGDLSSGSLAAKGPQILGATLASASWALIGLGLLGRAATRCRAIIRAHEQALAEGDALLRAEDEAQAPPADAPLDASAPLPPVAPLDDAPADAPADASETAGS
jgi:ABC-type transport system involved in multi-copper enzyme maturation permease subunit